MIEVFYISLNRVFEFQCVCFTHMTYVNLNQQHSGLVATILDSQDLGDPGSPRKSPDNLKGKQTIDKLNN